MDSLLLGELEGMATSALAAHGREDWDPNAMDAYDYGKQKNHHLLQSTRPACDDDDGLRFIVKLEGPIASPGSLASVLDLETSPPAYEGTCDDDGRSISFCKIDSPMRLALLSWGQVNDFRPLIISQSLSPKVLSGISVAPNLGIDSTLPQHRLRWSNIVPRPRQDEYPVWYFFYGTLADVEKLRHLFCELDVENEEYELLRARVRGGVLQTAGGGRYRALVDGPPHLSVHGSAFEVRSQEHEDILRSYETRAYEVVRCDIEMEGVGGMRCDIRGCTFRFRGAVD